MKAFTEIEALIIMCFYRFDKPKNIKKFLELFNQYFEKDISEQTIIYEISIIRSSEISANMAATEERVFYRKLWKRYSSGNQETELRQLYRDFKTGKFLEPNPENKTSNIRIDIIKPIEDRPVSVAELITIGPKEVDRRRKRIVAYALAVAGYKCECECGNGLFLRKDGQTPYTEGHHLIPLHYQRDFSYSLDVNANIISVCPSCHKKLHYGADNEEMLYALYEKRKERLEKCGISINFADLLLMYR